MQEKRIIKLIGHRPVYRVERNYDAITGDPIPETWDRAPGTGIRIVNPKGRNLAAPDGQDRGCLS
ncbi:hypothetical protein [Candidatus Methylocalor cossyra]|uniref:Uncharacterized protein n=1 Tax=Candidatus Methylocalor cossyra TaxID=3108543 RepID=A0ABM9NIU6_9GAMM